MKKRYLFMPVCLLAGILICFLFIGHNRRDEISDIMAKQISIEETSASDVWINSSDTTYNWVHRSLDFSIGVYSDREEETSVVFLFTNDDNQKITVHTDSRKLKTGVENIFHASVSRQKLSSGNWQMSAYLTDPDNHEIIPLKNPDTAGSDILIICTFHVR